jgi:hypothetical protein
LRIDCSALSIALRWCLLAGRRNAFRKLLAYFRATLPSVARAEEATWLGRESLGCASSDATSAANGRSLLPDKATPVPRLTRRKSANYLSLIASRKGIVTP